MRMPGVRHAGEPPRRSAYFGIQVNEEETLERIVREVAALTGVAGA